MIIIMVTMMRKTMIIITMRSYTDDDEDVDDDADNDPQWKCVSFQRGRSCLRSALMVREGLAFCHFTWRVMMKEVSHTTVRLIVLSNDLTSLLQIFCVLQPPF